MTTVESCGSEDEGSHYMASVAGRKRARPGPAGAQTLSSAASSLFAPAMSPQDVMRSMVLGPGPEPSHKHHQHMPEGMTPMEDPKSNVSAAFWATYHAIMGQMGGNDFDDAVFDQSKATNMRDAWPFGFDAGDSAAAFHPAM